MRRCGSPIKKLAADRTLLALSREHRTISLLEATRSRTTALATQQRETTEKRGGHEDRGHWRPT